MMYQVDYKLAREQAGFSYYISNGVGALADIAGLTHYDIYTDYKAGIKLYSDETVKKLDEMFDNKLRHISPATGHISYGHISCLGMELVFPKEGEVNYVHEDKSLDEWIKILQKEIILSPLAHEQFIYQEKLQDAFPDKQVGWTFGYEGPITTAYELRDMNIFYDVYDQPEKLKEFLYALTDNIVRYMKVYAKYNNREIFSHDGTGMCDDIASMFSPDLWDDYVLPYWNQYYNGMTDGKRFLHAEDLNFKHVKKLEKANIHLYDPSVSPKLNPRLIRDNSRVPFKWRMNGYYYNDLTVQEVRDWVFKAVADNASEIFSIVTYQQLNEEGRKKVLALEDACRISKEMLDKGAKRSDVAKLVSKAGNKKFWDEWKA